MTENSRAFVKETWPVPHWQTWSAPEDAGMATPRLAEYVAWLHSQAAGEPYGTIVIRRGRIVCEHYGSNADARSRWEIGSIRKSVTSALLGMAVAEEKLTLATPVCDIWPEIHRITGLDEDRAITVWHLATNSSGWMTPHPPGQTWLYNNAACTAGGCALGRIHDLPDDRLAPLIAECVAAPIGASAWDCYHYDEPFVPGSCGNPGPKLAIDSTMRDLARYGYLWLRDGEWNGSQLVPRDYVTQARTNQVSELGAHYGYWWFTNDGRILLPGVPQDAFFHVGNGREDRRTVCAVVPSLDLVAVVGTSARTFDITAGYRSQPVAQVDEWLGRIVAAMEDAFHA